MERTVGVSRATAERRDGADEVIVHEAAFEHDRNEIVAVAVTPRDAGNGTVLPVLEGVRMV